VFSVREQMPASDLHDKGTSVDERNAFSVIEWASGVFPASFILDSLKVKHRAVICTSDAELIMGIQKTKLNVSFGGYTAGDQRMLAANLEDFVNSGRPLLVANLTGVALKKPEGPVWRRADVLQRRGKSGWDVNRCVGLLRRVPSQGGHRDGSA
jgi:hypothetical protein